LITLGAGDDDVDPDPEHLGARCDQIDAVRLAGLDAEREVRCGTAHRAQVVEEHVDDVGERHAVSGSAADGRVRAAAVPAEGAVGAVEHEPAPVPGVQDSAPRHLRQRALTSVVHSVTNIISVLDLPQLSNGMGVF